MGFGGKSQESGIKSQEPGIRIKVGLFMTIIDL